MISVVHQALSIFRWTFSGAATLSGGGVTGLQIFDNGVPGYLNPSLASQISANVLDLTYGTFSGDIPTSWRTNSPIAGISQAAMVTVGQTGVTT